MLYRNLLAMEVEELLRSHPVDGAVLMGGCDKTTPGLLMGAISAGPAGDLPAGRADAARQLARQGARLGLRRLEVLGRAPRRQRSPTTEWNDDGGRHRALPGTCMTMGTAATMTAIAEALGLTLPGASSIPAADAGHIRMARRLRPAHRRDGLGGPEAGDDPDPRARSRTRIVVAMAMGGSTNAIIHLIAMARRAGVDVDARRFRRAPAARCR